MSIHLLDNNLINKIAAGEVVERPASVVKELMENSIDAGATAITVEIKNGGIDMVKIIDNGCGIPKTDIKTAFLRHATSKLSKIEDLDDIMTLGFRGEALSSIASVAQVEMVTKTDDDETGQRFVIHGGKVISSEEVGANTGTVFTMNNLFFNTPARRKFLKKPSTEAGYVSEIVNRIALGHPEIAIKYINNGNTILSTSGNGDLKTCLFYVYGKDIASKMLPLDYKQDGFRLSGLIAKPELSRGNRNYENFFINGRYIKSDTARDAIEDAYKGKLMVGKFPIIVLDLTVPPSTVDVNVHPRKLEVRFSDEDLIYDIIFKAVDSVLSSVNLIPEVGWDREKKVKPEPVLAEDYVEEENKPDINDQIGSKLIQVKNPEKSVFDTHYDNKMIFNDAFMDSAENQISEEAKTENYLYGDLKIGNKTKAESDSLESVPDNKPEKSIVSNKKPEQLVLSEIKEKKKFFNNYRVVGQIFNTYWIVEQENKMYLIDQHAAHERVLYEQFTESFKADMPMKQMLVAPVAVNLTEREKVVLNDNLELLERLGFEIEEFGINTYALRAVPYIFDEPGNLSFFTEIIDKLSEKNISNLYDTKYDAIASISCKAAVKGNDRLSYAEAQELINRLLKLENPFTCPHGRPTIIEMSRYEIEKKFKRIQD